MQVTAVTAQMWIVEHKAYPIFKSFIMLIIGEFALNG